MIGKIAGESSDFWTARGRNIVNLEVISATDSIICQELYSDHPWYRRKMHLISTYQVVKFCHLLVLQIRPISLFSDVINVLTISSQGWSNRLIDKVE